MEWVAGNQVYAALAILAFVLMAVVTGGVAYLTAAEWRDRRRRTRDQQGNSRRRQKSRRQS